MKAIRTFLSSKIFMHGLVVLGLLAIWGYIETESPYLILGIAASFAGVSAARLSGSSTLSTVRNKRLYIRCCLGFFGDGLGCGWPCLQSDEDHTQYNQTTAQPLRQLSMFA